MKNNFKYPIYAWLISDHKIQFEFIKIFSEQEFVILGKRSLVKEDPVSKRKAFVSISMSHAAVGTKKGYQIYRNCWDKSKIEFEKTKKIKGFECLLLDNSFRRVWLSNYEIKLLKKNKK
jgi:hypothetical protein